MKFTCERSKLSEAVGVVGRAAAVKSSLSALEGILIETGDGCLTLTGYDLDIGVVYTIPADIQVEGNIVLPCRLFTDILRKLPDGTVSVSTDEKFRTNINGGSVKFTIMGQSAMEYPELPTIIEGDELTLTNGAFARLLRQTVFAAADSDERPILQGILFDITPDEKNISAVAVDGVRLAIRKEKIIEFYGRNVQFVIPKKTVLEIIKNLPEDEEEKIKVSISHKHLIFEVADKRIISRRLEGEFLSYKNAIPAQFTFDVVMDKRRFATSLERAALLVSPTIRIPIHCHFDFGTVKISTATNMGKYNDEFETGSFHESMEIGFNHRYMLDALSACEEDEVRLELGNPKTPIVIKPKEGEDFIFLVLPMRLTQE